MLRETRREHLFACAGVGMSLILAAGCVVRTPAAPDRFDATTLVITPAADLPNPYRQVESLQRVADRPEADRSPETEQSRKRGLEMLVGRAGQDDGNVRYLGARGLGVLTEVTGPENEEWRQEEFTPHQRFRFMSTCWKPDQFADLEAQPDEALIANAPLVRIMDFTFHEPIDRDPVGLIVQLSSVVDFSPQERALTRAMVDRGWAVVGCRVPLFTFEEEAHFVVFQRGMGNDDVAKKVAKYVDDLVAEWAISVEAMLDYLVEARPDIPQDRTAIIGCSLGALVLPGTVAWNSRRFRAAVLIAGGANLLRILGHIQITDERDRSHRPISLHPVGPVDAAQVGRLYELYLAQSKLDPYAAADSLRNRPVLMLQSRQDAFIPAELGDLLYERLGRPERWSYPFFGHLLLFWWLPHEANAIADWIERAVE